MKEYVREYSMPIKLQFSKKPSTYLAKVRSKGAELAQKFTQEAKKTL